MTSIPSQSLKQYLESTYNYQIVGLIDLDWLASQPRNTLYKLFTQWHKPVFESSERIVFYSRNSISVDMLTHIQKCASMVDISNFFILICNSNVNSEDLEFVKKQYSTDCTVFSVLPLNFLDSADAEPVVPNPTINLPETFCFNPWTNLEISSQGEFRPCCVFKESIKDSTGRAYNINTDTLDKVYNSDYLKNLRQQFLDGQRPSECFYCWYQESLTKESNRIRYARVVGLDGHCQNIEKPSIENVLTLDIKLGNLCNFKCRICFPFHSSKFAEEQVRHFNSTINLKELNSKGQWAQNPKIWEMFNALGHQVVNIDFYGGEPFLIKQQEIFLDYLISNNHANRVRLHYNTNGSVYPTHLFEKWKLFKHVDIAFSIDNIDTRFEFERGGEWAQVQNNLDQFLQNRLPNMTLSVYATVNAQNVYYLDQLVAWYETKEFDNLFFNMLEEPVFLRITTMNQELTDMVVAKLSQIDSTKVSKYKIDHILESLKNTDCSKNCTDQMADYMLKLDHIRDQKFESTHPEVAQIVYKKNTNIRVDQLR